MKSLILLSYLVLGLISLAWTKELLDAERYDGFKVLRVQATTLEQYEILVDLATNDKLLDFWTDPTMNDFTDIMVHRQHASELEVYLNLNNISFFVHIDDVQKIIDEQAILTAKNGSRAMSWEAYQTLDTINDWLTSLASDYPSLVTLTNIGSSTEGRPLRVIKISTGGSNKIGFWIDGTIHAREWVATSTATYIINELVTKSNLYSDLLSAIDFYILPVINPDGYSYTHTTSRLWRKTRSNHGSVSCRGVDANRNFGYNFGGPGSSNDMCSETYRGPTAYSEPEALAMKNYIVSLSSTVNWQTSITLHSYSQLWMTPWGYTTDLPANYNELKRVADLAAAALTNVYGTRYQVGSASNILYHSSGSSRDWALGEGGFTYVYTLELRDTGNYGFLLPANQIVPTAIETWTGIQVVARNHLVK